MQNINLANLKHHIQTQPTSEIRITQQSSQRSASQRLQIMILFASIFLARFSPITLLGGILLQASAIVTPIMQVSAQK